MIRRSNMQKFHHEWKIKLLLMLLLACSFVTFVLIDSQRSRIQTLNLTPPNQSFRGSRRFLPQGSAMGNLEPPSTRKSKIALLFIVRNRLPLDIVWDVFFRGDGEDRFSVYVHSRPGFLLNASTTRSSYFLNRQINDSIQVDWGEASMIRAERILLQHALTDRLNERFIILSDSCIPLYNFSYTYEYIMSASTSFVDSFTDPKEDQYNPKMDPVVPVEVWRRGSQWVVLTRKHAEIVVQDVTVYPLFEQHCKKKSLPEFWRVHSLPVEVSNEHNCIPDEHYVQTLLSQKGLNQQVTRRPLTHSAWDLSSSRNHERRGWHPVTYRLADDTTFQLIQSIKDIDHISYKTEHRREWCTFKGKPSGCFLFARKFTRPAALHLLNLVLVKQQRKIDMEHIESLGINE